MTTAFAMKRQLLSDHAKKARDNFSHACVKTREYCSSRLSRLFVPGERRSCNHLPSKQAVAGSHPEYWLRGLSFGRRSGPVVLSFSLPAASQMVPAFFRRIPPGPTLPLLAGKPTAGSCGLSTKRWFICYGTRAHVLLRAIGNHPASAWNAGVEPAQTHGWSCLPPFPVPGPGATRCRTVLLCYACFVPMGLAAHSGPSASFPCIVTAGAGKMQGKVDVQVGTTRIRKLSCCQDVIVPLSEEK